MKSLLLSLALASCSLAAVASNPSIICNPEDPSDCYPKDFIATDEFQPIRPGQLVESGLHYRINVATGYKEAKKLDPSDTQSYDTVQVAKGTSEVLEYGNSSLVAVPDPEHPSGELQEAVEPIKPNRHVTPDLRSSFLSSVETLHRQQTAPKAELKEALETLQDISHEMEFGALLADPSPLTDLLKLISTSTDSSIRASSAIIIGNSLQNNANALKIAAKTHILPPLITALVKESDVQVKSNIMYAVSKVIRIPGVYKSFISQNALSTLRIVYQTHKDVRLRRKMSAFVEDEFLNKDMMSEDRATIDLEELGIRKNSRGPKDVQDVEIEGEMGRWCEEFTGHVVGLVKRNEVHEARAVVGTIDMLEGRFPGKCALNAVYDKAKERVLKETNEALE